MFTKVGEDPIRPLFGFTEVSPNDFPRKGTNGLTPLLSTMSSSVPVKHVLEERLHDCLPNYVSPLFPPLRSRKSKNLAISQKTQNGVRYHVARLHRALFIGRGLH